MRYQVLDYYEFKFANKEGSADEITHTLPTALQYQMTKLRYCNFRPGRPGVFKRPSRFPHQIFFRWCFCMGAQGA
jgi:hypothetical protein